MKTELKAKTVSKTVTKAKPAPKAKTAPKGKTLFYATTLADCLMGKYGPLIQRFYVSACSYHLAQKTTFPRPRLVGHALLKETEVGAWLTARSGTSIPAGDRTGQRLFDEMMVQAKSLPPAKKEAAKPAEKAAPAAPAPAAGTAPAAA